jgi:hypothetical protein
MADLTIEQLEELLQKKRSTVKVDIVPQKKCSFIPIRNPKHPCEKNPNVFYGELGYCSEHSRSVQARKAKQALDDLRSAKGDDLRSAKGDDLRSVRDDERLVKEAAQIETPEPEVKEVQVEVTSAKPKVEVKPPLLEGEKVKRQSIAKTEDSDSDDTVPSGKELQRPTVVKKSIRRNKWGNFEDPDTHIVFNARTKAAYGVQDHKSGKITALTPKHIITCEKYHWKYHVIEEDDESSGDESGEEEVEESQDEDEEDLYDEPEDEEDEEEVVRDDDLPAKGDSQGESSEEESEED